MPIEFNCESCSKLLRVPDGSGGKQCLCPACSKVLEIPAPKVDAPVVVPSPNNDASDIALCIPCPKCKHELICDPSLVGTKGQCRNCKHIFVISDLPTNETLSSEQTINWVFSCPNCNQLFEGSESMRGRRGKCHACGDVFAIELRVADEAPFESLLGKHDDEPAKPTNSFNSFDDDDLTLDVLPNEALATPEPTSKPDKLTTSSGTVVSRVSRGDRPAIQFNCTSCSGRMEVPGEAARQLTHCPHCKRQLTIPSESEPTPEALAANDPWANLSPLGSALTPTSQSSPFGETTYPPTPISSLTFGGVQRSSDPTQYIVCGIFISIFACFGIGFEIFEIVLKTMVLIAAISREPSLVTIATGTLVIWSFLLALSIAQLVGGIALARRTGLNTARTGVIICCLPCVCLINIAFGVWGCILVFGKDADRDFR